MMSNKTQPTSIFDKLPVVEKTSLIDVVNETMLTQALTSQPVTYGQVRNEDIIQCLRGQGYDSVMIPDENELIYINSIFQNKGFHMIENVTSEAVDNIGKQNFLDLDNKLKAFTNAMSGVKAAGILSIMTDLSKDMDSIDVDGVLDRAVNAKPTLLAMFFSLFDKHAKDKSVSKRLEGLLTVVNEKRGTVEGKLVNMENDLRNQYREQEQNIKMLDKCLKAYVETFKEMRRQFGLIVYLEYSYKSQLEQYKKQMAQHTDLLVGQKIVEYERILKNIENRRLLIQKTMTQLPLTSTQSNTLITVCQNLMEEINTTLISSFPSIRSSLVNLSAVISARKAMLGNELASKLESQLAMAATKSIGQLSVQSELVSAESRKREAETVQKIVQEMKANKQLVDNAKNQASQIMKDAGNLLTSLADDVKLIASGQ